MGMFNPDGSLKLTGNMAAEKALKEKKMAGRCILIRKEVVRDRAPKQCKLHLELSALLNDDRFVANILCQLRKETPMKLVKLEEKRFTITVETAFQRCTDCTRLINEYREFHNVIVEKGSCPYEGRKSFSYEDYFD